MESIATQRLRRRKRDEAMTAAHAAGKTYAEISREFGVSSSLVPKRIQFILRQKQIEQSADPFDRIQPHTARVLKSIGLETVEQVLAKYFAEELLQVRGFGRKALHDVEKHFLPFHYRNFERKSTQPEPRR